MDRPVQNLKVFHPKTTSITKEYDITGNTLGVGINGKVVQCIRKENGQRYALKVLSDNAKARREVELHLRASHCPNIVGVVDVFENNNIHTKRNHILVVMECMDGGELFNRIQSEAEHGFTEREAAKIVVDIATAIRHLHNMNIAHRDLKPENLLFSKNGSDGVLKLTDFGFAKEVNQQKTLETPCFTPYYVAPEVLGHGKYDKSCDLWSLGVITYILLCGYPPFYSHHGQSISPGMKTRIRNGEYTFPDREWRNVSLRAKDLIMKLLVIDPDQRLTIGEVFQHPWISQCTQVPLTPLATSTVLNVEKDNLTQINESMGAKLNSMRVDREDVPALKDLKDSNNPILRKRRKKLQAQTPKSEVIQEELSVMDHLVEN